MKKPLLFIFLFILFFAYRIHFWQSEITLHAFINALFDVSLSIACGIAIYHLNKRYSGKWMFPFSMLIITAFSYALFYSHKLVYYYNHMLDDDFQYMFHTVCFQLLDSCSIVITGALVYLLFLFSLEKTLIQNDLKELALAKNKEELKYLKTKINPYFIFNGLENIYREIDIDKEQAKKKLIQFSDIIRYHLQYASLEKVSFNTEIKYLKSYIDFLYQGASKSLDLVQEFSIKDPNKEIAPLVFIPFIENAFRYCSSSNSKKGKIDLRFEFHQSHLEMKLMNTYNPNIKGKNGTDEFDHESMIKRLELNYSGKYDLKIDDLVEDEVYKCQLKIAI